MSEVTATVRHGRVEADVPSDWPDGAKVLIELSTSSAQIGLREVDWPTTSEELAKHLELMDRLEPLNLTPEEEAAWAAERLANKVKEKDIFLERSEKLRRMWE